MPNCKFSPYYLGIGSVLVLFLLLRLTSSSVQHLHTHHADMDHSEGSSIHHGDSNMMMMPMWFMWTVDTILWFKSWHPTSLLPYLGMTLLLGCFAIVHEALASYRVSFARSNIPAPPQGYVAVPSERFKVKSQVQLRAVNSLLYTANITTGYLLMLAVMSFNVGFFVAVVVGMGIGHFVFFSKPWHLEMARVDACCETTVGLAA